MTANLTTLQRFQASIAATADVKQLVAHAMEALVLYESRDFGALLDFGGDAGLVLACRAELGKNWGINPHAIVLETVRATLDQVEAEEAAALNEQANAFEYARMSEDFGF